MKMKVLTKFTKSLGEVYWEGDLYRTLALSVWRSAKLHELMKYWIEDRIKQFP